MKNKNKNTNKSRRRLLFLLITLLLVSGSYFALELSSYYEGERQVVQGYSSGNNNSGNQKMVEISILTKEKFNLDYWNVLRKGRLFIKDRPVVSQKQEETDQKPEAEPDDDTPLTQPAEPECPWILKGVMLGKEPTAILANKQTQISKPVKDGERLGEYRVVKIYRDYVILAGPEEEELKLKLGGE